MIIYNILSYIPNLMKCIPENATLLTIVICAN